jgi:hypothetical protein
MAADRLACRSGITDDLGDAKASEGKANKGGCQSLLRLPAESPLSF